uniref:LRRCT domain-containing protein n=1 Tax=Strigamia maritima TaxID=126957 RepID=T1JDL4_STRMM
MVVTRESQVNDVIPTLKLHCSLKCLEAELKIPCPGAETEAGAPEPEPEPELDQDLQVRVPHLKMSCKLHLTFLLMSAFCLLAAASCPDQCMCDTDRPGRKRVSCIRGGIHGTLPLSQIDRDIQVLVVSAPRDNPNELTLGRVFMKYPQLEEVHITNSRIPAIGENTFWGATTIKTLNLTRNKIANLVDINFSGLDNLENLHLDDNNITAMPSAIFRYVPKLRNLTMARNNIEGTVPRMFQMLANLEHLDLSSNPISNMSADNFVDIGKLRKLYLSRCKLTKLNPAILRHLPKLDTLDLSRNQIKFISPTDFGSVTHLKHLYLHGNKLATVLENTFSGHNLTVLTLARNKIRILLQECFFNLTVKALDLSHNMMDIPDPEFLRPVADSLIKLDISGNRILSTTLSLLLDNLLAIRDLSVTHLGLTEIDPKDLQFPGTLRKLNLSSNHLTTFSVELVKPLRLLETLDLSWNKLRGLDQRLIKHLDSMPHLRTLNLQGNEWSCDLCYIPALLAWLNSLHFFDGACNNLLNPNCLKCYSPYNLSGQAIQLLAEEDLEPCELADMPALSADGAQAHVGVIVVCAILVLLLVAITVVFILYYRRGADYYTHEEERDDEGMYENPVAEEENGDLLKKPQIATIETMDEFKDDGKHPHKSLIA